MCENLLAQLGSAINLKLKSDSLEKVYQSTTGALSKREIEDGKT